MEWGESAFQAARERDVPIFLSVGYSTCHWCHVMARESFEEEAIAARLNELFVNVKLDREERPDVDRVYMSFVQSLTGSGGWPMSVWLTPDLEPFYGGTYFPPEDRYGRLGFPALIERIGRHWAEDRVKLLDTAARSMELLEGSAGEDMEEGVGEASDAIDACLEQLSEEFDEEWGGFGPAPKFPMPAYLNLLLECVAQRKNARLGELVSCSLSRMQDGGVWDHLGGGFHRYSVDRYWHIPHYEKMLYDQGQLAGIYATASQQLADRSFARTAREIVDYVARDLCGADGNLLAAEDADSALAGDLGEHAEGAFYVWRSDEIAEVLGEDADLLSAAYGAKSTGNARPESDPHGELRGTNTLFRARTSRELADSLGLDPEEVRRRLSVASEKLFAVRCKRPRPHLDDKTITSWNALMISGACKVYQIDGYEAALNLAQRAADFLWNEMWDRESSQLSRIYREGLGEAKGFAEDYAAFACACLDLYESSFEELWIERAEKLLAQTSDRFLDTRRAGFFATRADDQGRLPRLRDDYDGAEPAASSMAAIACLRLAAMIDNDALRELGRRTIEAFGQQWKRAPRAMPLMLVAASRFLAGDQQIVVVGPSGAAIVHQLLRTANRQRKPGSVLLFVDSNPRSDSSLLRNQKLQAFRDSVPAGSARAFVCENFVCQEPVSTEQALRALLEQ